MRISDTRIVANGDQCELRANVNLDTHWVWGDAPFELWYSFPAAYREYLDASNGDPFFAAFLFPAMALGEPLVIEATVSPLLLDAVPKIFEVVRCWNRNLTLTDVEAPRRDVAGPVPDRSGHHGLFFSMGVDSSYSLLKNVHSLTSAPISHLVVVEGFDIYLWERQRFPPLLQRTRHVAAEFGKTVIPVTTNLRDITDRVVDWVKLHHGAALASVGLALGNHFAAMTIAAAQTYSRLFGSGTHPLLDPLWGAEHLRYSHDGLEASRLDKIRYISREPSLVNNLRVCGTSEVTSAYNCGRCEKCLRTMLGLHVAGVLDQSDTFERTLDPGLIRTLAVRSQGIEAYLREVFASLSASGPDRALKEALEECLSRHQGVPSR